MNISTYFLVSSPSLCPFYPYVFLFVSSSPCLHYLCRSVCFCLLVIISSFPPVFLASCLSVCLSVPFTLSLSLSLSSCEHSCIYDSSSRKYDAVQRRHRSYFHILFICPLSNRLPLYENAKRQNYEI